MYDISSHKLAGMFARPLTEREAPGYRDLIYRPQDLKSIRSAIVAGTRALATATSAENGAEEKGGSVMVGVGPDVVPPRGIVNSAQLEKELMRMFANAVMFNPDEKRGVPKPLRKRGGGERHVPVSLRGEQGREGEGRGEREESGERESSADEGGLVRDTREMCEAVEAKVEGWRLAENLGAGKGRGVEEREEIGEERGEVRGGEIGEEMMAEETVGDETVAEEMGNEEVGRKRGKGKEKEFTPTVTAKRRRRR